MVYAPLFFLNMFSLGTIDFANALNRTSLHASTQILAQSLLSLSTHLETHSPLLASTAVYPVPSYPGREKEGLLGQLLRKKLEPGVEDWVGKGQKTGEQVVGEDGEEWKELWEWAAVRGNELAREHEWGGEEGSEEELEMIGKDEENDKMQGVEGEGSKVGGRVIDLNEILRFMSKGEEPQGQTGLQG